MENASRLYSAIRSVLFGLDAEKAHHLAMKSARIAGAVPGRAMGSLFTVSDSRLEQTLFDVFFRNPVGLAPGFDKNGVNVDFWPNMGFGFVELGSVSARPSPGNPKPRVFRIPENEALVNRMGLNNDGAHVIAERLRSGKPSRIPIGINLAKTHDPGIMGPKAVRDFVSSFRHLSPHAAYIALNVSCPNTREGKTFEDPEALQELLEGIFEERERLNSTVPVLVKWSPPPVLAPEPSTRFDGYRRLIEVALSHPISGMIATNTASDRHGLTIPATEIAEIGAGGLSGKPLAERSLSLTRFLYRELDGKLPIIGVGGIDSSETAYQRIRAGASLIQVYTGLIYHGPGLVKRINKGLLKFLDRDGISDISDAVGLDAGHND